MHEHLSFSAVMQLLLSWGYPSKAPHKTSNKILNNATVTK